MTVTVRKAVIPAAGLGTRFLPVTKATPKEMLPVVDKPAIQYVVEEAATAGLFDALLVTGRNKRALEDHFDRNHELATALADKGDMARLAAIETSEELAKIHYVRQGDPRGLGHAVLCAAAHIGAEPFAVLLGDDLIDPRDPLLTEMLEVQQEYGGCVIALTEVDPVAVSRYGCAAVSPAKPSEPVRVTDLVEKPAPDQAPSNLAVIGRYVLAPEIFDVLRATPPGRGGEIQLTDAIRNVATGAAAGGSVHGVIFRGSRYDTGDRSEYLQAVVRLACKHEDLGSQFSDWLKKFAATEI
ncbi:UTP--glucose-1-phosphate uridylyltransferase [Streptomyces sulphureus]|uniref:UTP--glucose-1-phosphate uridylyltransferase n=1 Tax=Streptomyces sulphureus TaxID=47758 RepID=UPI0003A681E6|nr:UTP--glucose-1-phosphate uridylyltransferase [Streptomyces sulphureus]